MSVASKIRIPVVASVTVLMLAFAVAPVPAQSSPSARSSPQPIYLEVFGRGDSELSDDARSFAQALGNRTRGLEVIYHDVLEDKQQGSSVDNCKTFASR